MNSLHTATILGLSAFVLILPTVLAADDRTAVVDRPPTDQRNSHYAGNRATRGLKLPRGFQHVDAMRVEAPQPKPAA